MSAYRTLLDNLNQRLVGNSARMKVLSDLILGLIRCREVNLVKLASFQSSNATQESQHGKLQRFFKLWELPWKQVAELTLSKIPKPKKGYVLSMNRTNWKFGKTHINILTVGVVVGKVAVSSCLGNPASIHQTRKL